MRLFLNILPFLFSTLLGVFLIYILDKEKKVSFPFKILFGTNLGLGLSALITFMSFLFFNQLHRSFIITLHLVLFISFIKISPVAIPEMIKKLLIIQPLKKKNIVFFFILLLCLLPTIYMNSLYPHGGWDAWAAWNFKAKTLFLGQEQWTNIFHPAVWRSNPNYPLFLPLLNVWGWIFSSEPTQTVPMIIAILFSALNLTLLFYSLKNHLPLFLNALFVLALSYSPIFYKFASSQYADVVIGSYVFSCLYSLLQTKTHNNKIFPLLSGIFLGVLSFTKNEGFLISVIIFILAIFYLSLQETKTKKIHLAYFLAGTFISLIPLIVFRLFYAPEDPKFINGLTSIIRPSTAERLKMITAFYFLQLKNLSFNGLWILLLTSILVAGRKAFDKTIVIIPIFLCLYGGALTFYYFVNTYFEIVWWLTVTWDRVLFSILPVTFYWIGVSLFPKEKS